MAEHRDYDGRELRCSHILAKGTAKAVWAWDDWYYVHVDGWYPNGNRAFGVYCREQAHTIKEYLKGGAE